MGEGGGRGRSRGVGGTGMTGVGDKGRKGREEDIWREEMGTHLKDDRECIFGDGNGTNLSGNKMGHRVSKTSSGCISGAGSRFQFQKEPPN